MGDVVEAAPISHSIFRHSISHSIFRQAKISSDLGKQLPAILLIPAN